MAVTQNGVIDSKWPRRGIDEIVKEIEVLMESLAKALQIVVALLNASCSDVGSWSVLWGIAIKIRKIIHQQAIPFYKVAVTVISMAKIAKLSPWVSIT